MKSVREMTMGKITHGLETPPISKTGSESQFGDHSVKTTSRWGLLGRVALGVITLGISELVRRAISKSDAPQGANKANQALIQEAFSREQAVDFMRGAREQAVDFENKRGTPELAKAFLQAGFVPEEAVYYLKEWFNSPEQAHKYLAAGGTWGLAKIYSDLMGRHSDATPGGLWSPDSAINFLTDKTEENSTEKARGLRIELAPKQAFLWEGGTPEQAADFQKAGFSPTDAISFLKTGLTVQQAVNFQKEEFIKMGLTVQQAVDFQKAQLTLDDARRLLGDGLTPAQCLNKAVILRKGWD